MKTFWEETTVEFYPIAHDLMDQYIDSGEYKDKRGLWNPRAGTYLYKGYYWILFKCCWFAPI